MNAIRNVTGAILGALVLFGGGLWLGGHPESLPSGLRDVFVDDDRALRAEVVDTIEDNFIRKVDRSRLRDASFKGIVQSLDDRFSHYFTPDEYQRFSESVRGRFSGVGLTIDEVRRGLQVLSVIEGSPAAGAGIRKGDIVTGVNGRSIAGEDANLATARIKGKQGTRVRLSVLRPDDDRTRTYALTRRRIEVPITRGRLRTRDGKRLGVVQLASFTSGAHGRVRQEVGELLNKGAKGIVLDLRGNGGGLLDEAVLVSSIFIEDGLVVSTDGRTKPKREFTARGEAIDGDIPVVVLADRSSASASEIVTGALKDRRRATFVGTRTFGKGVFQEVARLSNGGALDITVGKYFLPSGANIQDKGIEPDVVARDLVKTDRDEALPIALDTLAGKVR